MHYMYIYIQATKTTKGTTKGVSFALFFSETTKETTKGVSFALFFSVLAIFILPFKIQIHFEEHGGYHRTAASVAWATRRLALSL